MAQRRVQNSVCWPSPIACAMPLCKIERISQTPFQALEGCHPGSMCSVPTRPLQYLCRRTLAQSVFRSRISRHPSLVIDAELSSRIARIPRPPSSIGLVIMSHATKCGFRPVFVPAHKTFALYNLAHRMLLWVTGTFALRRPGWLTEYT